MHSLVGNGRLSKMLQRFLVDRGTRVRATALWKRLTTTATFCLALASCGQMTMEDVGSTPEYSGVIGTMFWAKEDLWAIGVTTDKSYQKKVDYVVLVPGPGFSGPEVVSKEPVTRGFVFRVTGVLRAASFASSKVVYVVEDARTGKFKGMS